MNLRDLIPPAVLRLKQRAEQKKAYRKYPTYGSALAHCVQDGYENSELCAIVAEKTVRYRDALQKIPYTVEATSAFALFMIHSLVRDQPNGALTVLDFGGACGAHYFEVRRSLPLSQQLTWIVVETPHMVAAAQSKKLNNQELSFQDTLSQLPKIDLIHSSCALHYSAAPYTNLDNLLALNAPSLLIHRMMFTQGDTDFITIQQSRLSSNGPGALPPGYTDRHMSYPHTTLSFPKFDAHIRQHGYDLRWIFTDPAGSFNIPHEPIIGRGMLYTKTLR